MQTTKFRCPNPECRVTLSIPAQIQGQRVRCAGCGQSFVVPPTSLKGTGITKKRNRRSGGNSDRRAA